jgi:hypothetical protein
MEETIAKHRRQGKGEVGEGEQGRKRERERERCPKALLGGRASTLTAQM